MTQRFASRLNGELMNRHASTRLRLLVDEAVGPHYDAVFLRLDVLATSPAGRCGCAGCALAVGRTRSAVLAGLPEIAPTT